MPQKKNICNTNNLYNITPSRETFFLFKDRPSRLWNLGARIACFVVVGYSKVWAGIIKLTISVNGDPHGYSRSLIPPLSVNGNPHGYSRSLTPSPLPPSTYSQNNNEE